MAEWLTMKEIAERLAVSESAVYRLTYQANIPASRLGNTWRFNKERVDNWFTDDGHKRILSEEQQKVESLQAKRRLREERKAITKNLTKEGNANER